MKDMCNFGGYLCRERFVPVGPLPAVAVLKGLEAIEAYFTPAQLPRAVVVVDLGVELGLLPHVTAEAVNFDLHFVQVFNCSRDNGLGGDVADEVIDRAV